MKIFLADKIAKIYPDAQFELSDDDLSTLVFHNDLDLQIPTAAQLAEAEKAILADRANVEAKRETALDKLAALGLDADDLKALGL